MHFAEEADPVGDVLVGQRADNDVDGGRAHPVEWFIERVHPQFSTAADTSTSELDHRRRGITAEHFGSLCEKLLHVEAGTAGGVEHPLAPDISDELEGCRTVVERVVGRHGGVVLVLGRERVVLLGLRRGHANTMTETTLTAPETSHRFGGVGHPDVERIARPNDILDLR